MTNPAYCVKCGGDRYGSHMDRPGEAVAAGPAADAALRAALTDHLVPLWKVPDDAYSQGFLRRCLLCGRLSRIVHVAAQATVEHEPDCAFEAAVSAALATKGERDG